MMRSMRRSLRGRWYQASKLYMLSIGDLWVWKHRSDTEHWSHTMFLNFWVSLHVMSQIIYCILFFGHHEMIVTCDFLWWKQLKFILLFSGVRRVDGDGSSSSHFEGVYAVFILSLSEWTCMPFFRECMPFLGSICLSESNKDLCSPWCHTWRNIL